MRGLVRVAVGRAEPGEWVMMLRAANRAVVDVYFDWTTEATSVVVLVFVRVRSGASARLGGAICGEYTSQWRL